MQVSDGNPNVNCASFAVNENNQTIPYVVCANISQEDSPYFDAVSGNTVWRTDSRAVTSDGRVYPEYTCKDGRDNDDDNFIDYPADTDCAKAEDDEFSDSHPYRYRNNPMDPDLFSMQDIYMGVSNQDKPLESVRIYFAGAPDGATFTYAIYADGLRDDGPNKRVFVSATTEIPQVAGEYSFPVAGVTLEHTKRYYLLVKSNSGGVLIHEKDARYGVRIKDSNPNDQYYAPISGPVNFDETFPSLHLGLSATANISLTGGSFSSYCVWKTQGGNCSNQSLNGSSFTENFSDYAVHVYKFVK